MAFNPFTKALERMKFSVERMVDRIREYENVEIKCINHRKTAYSNHVYKIDFPSKSIIYKEYSSNNHIRHNRTELDIQRKIGFPRILYIHPEYRIEEYVEHQEVCWTRDLGEIALALRRFHDFGKICDLDYFSMFDTLFHRELERMKEDAENDKRIVILEDMRRRLEWYKGVCTPVLCHNDAQIGNMMKINGEVRLIDYEYACMGDPCVDIANLFCEKMCDYTKDYILREEIGWGESEKREFLRIYSGRGDVDDIYKKVCEAEVFSHFYWHLWGKNKHLTRNGSSDSFNYKEFGENRLHWLRRKGFIGDEDYFTLLKETCCSSND
jgi:thiamine kinase-like enzyme